MLDLHKIDQKAFVNRVSEFLREMSSLLSPTAQSADGNSKHGEELAKLFLYLCGRVDFGDIEKSVEFFSRIVRMTNVRTEDPQRVREDDTIEVLAVLLRGVRARRSLEQGKSVAFVELALLGGYSIGGTQKHFQKRMPSATDALTWLAEVHSP